MKYAQIEEVNDWEGEEWFFYIPLEKNKKGIEFLKEVFEDWKDEEVIIRFTGETLLENEVDTLVKYGGSGYLNNHNKLEGVLDYERLKTDINTIGASEALGKGDIRNYMIEE